MLSQKELLILVDKNDNILGYEEKIKCHLGRGTKHRAFSVFIFDRQGRLLIQKRAQSKMLWPGFWANTCCSHPRKGEDYLGAAQRRLKEEMGIKTDLKLAFKFSYEAQYQDIGSENELCAVFGGRWQGDDIQPDSSEVAEWKWMTIDEIKQDIESKPELYAPWFKIEMKRIEEIKKRIA